jgi:hypothetical protein
MITIVGVAMSLHDSCELTVVEGAGHECVALNVSDDQLAFWGAGLPEALEDKMP